MSHQTHYFTWWIDGTKEMSLKQLFINIPNINKSSWRLEFIWTKKFLTSIFSLKVGVEYNLFSNQAWSFCNRWRRDYNGEKKGGEVKKKTKNVNISTYLVNEAKIIALQTIHSSDHPNNFDYCNNLILIIPIWLNWLNFVDFRIFI